MPLTRRGVNGAARQPGESGAVTAETAVVLPALVVVFAVLATGAQAVQRQLACADAARVAARLAARGESVDDVRRAAQSVAPDRAGVSVVRSDGLVRVTVTARVPLLGLGALPTVDVAGRAVAADEAADGEQPW